MGIHSLLAIIAVAVSTVSSTCELNPLNRGANSAAVGVPCMCVGNPLGAVAVRAAASPPNTFFVFLGKVDSVRPSPQRFYFTVERWFGGGVTRTFTLYAETSITSCSILFKEGEEWLVVATRGPDSLVRTRQCTGTQPTARVDSTLRYLGTGWTPRS